MTCPPLHSDIAMSLVYSTDKGRICPDCRQPQAACRCRRAAPAPATGAVRIQRQTHGRAGKVVTVISGLPLGAEALQELAKALKRRCGGGGAVKDGNIEIQGDHRALLQAELEQRGYKVKLSGG
jgi:translation initiation factor 1